MFHCVLKGSVLRVVTAIGERGGWEGGGGPADGLVVLDLLVVLICETDTFTPRKTGAPHSSLPSSEVRTANLCKAEAVAMSFATGRLSCQVCAAVSAYRMT
jgi:hypothetical protein